jgi:hypothetical protein
MRDFEQDYSDEVGTSRVPLERNCRKWAVFDKKRKENFVTDQRIHDNRPIQLDQQVSALFLRCFEVRHDLISWIKLYRSTRN